MFVCRIQVIVVVVTMLFLVSFGCVPIQPNANDKLLVQLIIIIIIISAPIVLIAGTTTTTNLER